MRRVEMTLAATAVAVGLLVVYSQQAVHTQQAETSAAQPLAPGIEWAWGYRVGTPIPADLLPKPQRLGPTDDTLFRIPGSSLACTLLAIERPGDGTHDGVLDVCDWYPEDRAIPPDARHRETRPEDHPCRRNLERQRGHPRMRAVPSADRRRPERERPARRHVPRLHHSAAGGLQERPSGQLRSEEGKRAPDDEISRRR